MASASRHLKRSDHRVIIHFVRSCDNNALDTSLTSKDYDCFYASVFEAENPALKTQPLAVQQKQIIVTCNYVARERGLHKLQLIKDVKKVCPEVIIVLGEDLTRFRDASKSLYRFIQGYSWNGKVERLGFDEVFIDVSDIIDYNISVLNHTQPFFQLHKSDPTIGFAFDATCLAGHAYPEGAKLDLSDTLTTRLILGSHLAEHIQKSLEEQKNFTSTIGVSTNRILSKLVGNVHKPRGLTTLIPPYDATIADNNVTSFLDPHDIGAVPWIGFKLAQKLRGLALNREAAIVEGLNYGRTRENVSVGDVRAIDGLTPELLESTLSGPGMQRGIGKRVFQLLYGIDDVEVAHARDVPRQISIEDSYLRLDNFGEIKKQIVQLSTRLIERMRMDLIADDDSEAHEPAAPRWLAHAQTLRLTTRPRLPVDPVTHTRPRTFKRISRSTTAPQFLHSFHTEPGVLADRLVESTLLPLFKRLHPHRDGLNLSLMNVAVTDFVEVAPKEEPVSNVTGDPATTRSVNGTGANAARTLGRDVRGMFARQEEVLRPFRVIEDEDQSVSSLEAGSEDTAPMKEDDADLLWLEEDEDWRDNDGEQGFHSDPRSHIDDESTIPSEQGWSSTASNSSHDPNGHTCLRCGFTMPLFAQEAHERFHAMDTSVEEDKA